MCLLTRAKREIRGTARGGESGGRIGGHGVVCDVESLSSRHENGQRASFSHYEKNPASLFAELQRKTKNLQSLDECIRFNTRQFLAKTCAKFDERE